MDRTSLATYIVERLASQRQALQAQWRRDRIANIVVDDVLPRETAQALFEAFPAVEHLHAKKSLGESRYVGADPRHYHPLLTEAVCAFQDSRVMAEIFGLTGHAATLLASQSAAGGISRMDRGHFVHPHLDRQLDAGGRKHQVFSLQYFLTPDLRLADGGHLELWHAGPEGEATTILSKFNRLVMIVTHGAAWHSVSPVRSNRHCCCIWNRYFAQYRTQPLNDNHVPVFRGRPEQKLRDLVLRADTFVRESLYRVVLDHLPMNTARLTAGEPDASSGEPAFAPSPPREGGESINRGV